MSELCTTFTYASMTNHVRINKCMWMMILEYMQDEKQCRKWQYYSKKVYFNFDNNAYEQYRQIVSDRI